MVLCAGHAWPAWHTCTHSSPGRLPLLLLPSTPTPTNTRTNTLLHTNPHTPTQIHPSHTCPAPSKHPPPTPCCCHHTTNTGVDMLVDVHGDEELPYCFIAGSEGIPGWSKRMSMMQVLFSQLSRGLCFVLLYCTVTHSRSCSGKLRRPSHPLVCWVGFEAVSHAAPPLAAATLALSGLLWRRVAMNPVLRVLSVFVCLCVCPYMCVCDCRMPSAVPSGVPALTSRPAMVMRWMHPMKPTCPSAATR